MKDLRKIVVAYAAARALGQKTAILTVVEVEGSAYRREGARMLVDETGQITGAISGGCLEGDALRQAQKVMTSGRPALVEYDSRDEADDLFFGAQLGCRGLIRVLIEPLFEPLFHSKSKVEKGPIQLFESVLEARRPAVLSTFFSKKDRKGAQLGTRFCMFEGDEKAFFQNASELEKQLEPAVAEAFLTKKSLVAPVFGSEKADSALVDFVRPEPRLAIFGAGNDAQPLVKMAAALGWPTAVIDGRPRLATRARFPEAESVETARAADVFEKTEAARATHFLLLTHNYSYDLTVFRQLLDQNPSYVGLLGPRKKFERMLADLASDGFSIDEKWLKKVFAPVGLDLGSGSAEAIALSILAEIQALESGRAGGFLRDRAGPING